MFKNECNSIAKINIICYHSEFCLSYWNLHLYVLLEHKIHANTHVVFPSVEIFDRTLWENRVPSEHPRIIPYPLWYKCSGSVTMLKYLQLLESQNEIFSLFLGWKYIEDNLCKDTSPWQFFSLSKFSPGFHPLELSTIFVPLSVQCEWQTDKLFAIVRNGKEGTRRDFWHQLFFIPAEHSYPLWLSNYLSVQWIFASECIKFSDFIVE